MAYHIEQRHSDYPAAWNRSRKDKLRPDSDSRKAWKRKKRAHKLRSRTLEYYEENYL